MITIIITKFTRESTQKAINNFENLKRSIKGLYAILSIIASKENDLFIKIGMDNIEALYQNFLELIFNDYGFRKFVRKIKSSEIELDIPLGDLLLS